MERCVFNAIKYAVFNIISPYQHSFIARRPWVTQLTEELDQIGAHLDKGGQVDVIYVDISKAFDKISHGQLLRKLRHYSLGGKLLL